MPPTPSALFNASVASLQAKPNNLLLINSHTGLFAEMFRETHKPLSGRASRKVERNPLISDRSGDTTAPGMLM